MFDAILFGALREIPRQLVDAMPVVLAFAKANPVVTMIIVGALMIGGSTRGRAASSRVR